MAVASFPGLLFGIVFLHGLDNGNVEATTCTNVTDFTCPVTLFSNGTCLETGHCACMDGYSAGDYGCQKDLVRPHIRMTDNEALPVGTGIMAWLSMTCEPAESDVTYTWRRNGDVIGESGATVTHSERRISPVETFRYSCQYSVNGRDSPESHTFELMVFAKIEDIDPDDDKFKPAVRGVPTTVVEGVELRLSCVNYIYHQVQRVDWSLPNGDYNGMEWTLKITQGMDDSDISCTVVYSLDIPIKSLDVRIPKMSDDIPNVVIREGDRFVESGQEFNLTCSFVEDDFVTRGISITWGWSHGGVPDTSLTTQSITIPTAHQEDNEGQWQCWAMYGSRDKKESAPVHVYVDVPINITATATPARAIKGGIMEILCDVYSPTLTNFSYGWTLNEEDLMGYFDDTIFVHFADGTSSTLSGDYICTVTVDQRTATSDTMTVSAPILFSDTQAPTLQVKGNPQEFLYGDIYELECLYSEDFTVPGIQFEYFQEGIRLDNSTVLMEETGYQALSCRATFDGLETRESQAVRVSVSGGPNSTVSSDPDTTSNSSLLHIEAFDNDTASPNSTTTPDSTTRFGAGRLRQPMLRVVDHSVNSSFVFNQTYRLKCQLYDEDSYVGVRYEFSQDGVALRTGESSVYTITSDVVNKVYTCRAASPNMSSPTSNAVTVSFDVFDKVHITWKASDVTTCSAKVTLGCDVELLPGVPDQVNYTWYDKEMDVLHKSRTLSFDVTQGFLQTFYCQAEVGSHSKTATLTIMVRGTDEHCSACSLSMSWTLILIPTTFLLSLL